MRNFFFLTAFLLACSNNTSVPKDVLPPAKMGAVLYDVIAADEMVDFLKLGDSTYQPFSRRTALYDTVFRIHSTTKNEFKKSLEYYQSRPDLLKGLLDSLQKRLTDTSGNNHSKRKGNMPE